MASRAPEPQAGTHQDARHQHITITITITITSTSTISITIIIAGDGGGGARTAQNQISVKLRLGISYSAGGAPQIIPMLGLKLKAIIHVAVGGKGAFAIRRCLTNSLRAQQFFAECSAAVPVRKMPS